VRARDSGSCRWIPIFRSIACRAVLEEKRLSPPIDPGLVAVARRDDDDSFGSLRAELGLAEDDEPVFVSLDARHRTRAADRGFRVAPHAELVDAVLNREELHYARLSGRRLEEPDWEQIVNILKVTELSVVPVHRTREPEPVLYAIASSRALEKLEAPPFVSELQVKRLTTPPVWSRSRRS
jgi:hypothetical protein